MIKGETVLSGAAHPHTELKIMNSPAGHYLGFADADGSPYSRETTYMSFREARAMLQRIRGHEKDYGYKTKR